MIPGLLLAAGLSRRFGSQKLLVNLGSKTLFEYALRIHLKAGLAPLVAVVSPEVFSFIMGKEKDDMAYHMVKSTTLGTMHLETPWGISRSVLNETPETGMAESLKQGLAALTLEEREKGVLISLADMPGVTTEAIHKLVEEYRLSAGKIVAPVFQDKLGHPVIIHEPSFREEIEMISGDKGLRDILKAHWDEVVKIPWEDDSVVFDVDTMEDMVKFLRK